jgi:hypothetical protein
MWQGRSSGCPERRRQMTLLELANEFQGQMESCCKTKTEQPKHAMLTQEYWAGKEQAWYEAWRAVVALAERSKEDGQEPG